MNAIASRNDNMNCAGIFMRFLSRPLYQGMRALLNVFVLCLSLLAWNGALAQTTTTTTLANGSSNPISAGSSFYINAVVTGSNPTGTVSFYEGTTLLGKGTLSSSKASWYVTVKTAGTHIYTASYSGDSGNVASTSDSLSLTVAQATPTVSLTVSPNPAVKQAQVTLAAAVGVSGPDKAGTVTFFNGNVVLGTVDLTYYGQATLTTSFPEGNYSLTARYSGNADVIAKTTSAVALVVNPYQQLFEYDAEGHLIGYTDPIGSKTELRWDSLGRMDRQMLFGNNGYANYIYYDGSARIKRFLDGTNITTTYAYDGFGNTTAVKSSDTGNAGYEYDANGNLTKKTDARGVVATYSYDALNRLEQIVYAKNGTTVETVGLTWDTAGAIGRIDTMQDSSGATSWRYDPQGRVLSRTQTLAAQTAPNGTGLPAKTLAVSYRYNDIGQLVGMTYPSGHQIVYQYNSAGQLTEVDLDSRILIGNLSYAPFGPVQSWVWGNAQVYNRSYDINGRLVRFSLGNAMRTVVWDGASRITALQDQALGEASPKTIISAGYDRRSRLTTYSSPLNNYAYTYDASNNRGTITVGKTTYNQSSISNNRIYAATGPGKARSYVYDEAGNPKTDGISTYTWTSSGFLSTLTQSGVTTGYAYNASAQRVRKMAATVADSALYAYDEAGHLIGEYDGNGKLLAEHIWLGDTPIAVTQANSGTTTTPTQSLYYVFADQINTPRVLTDTNGKVIWNWEGEGFGMVQPNEDPDGDGTKVTYNLRFPGQVYDKESGLFYNWHRYYDPTTGRYISSDPIGLEGGINTYAYVGGDPVLYRDPSGKFAANALAAGAGAVFGGAFGFVSSLTYQYYKCKDFAHVDWWAVAQSTGLGAVGGAITGATFGVGGAAAESLFAAGMGGSSGAVAGGVDVAIEKKYNSSYRKSSECGCNK